MERRPARRQQEEATPHFETPWGTVGAIALLALGWLMVSTGIDFASFGETTAQLKISKAPFIMGMGFMCALAGIVHLILVFRPLGEDEESEGGVL